MKHCSICNQFKDPSNFYRLGGSNRLQSRCKSCGSIAAKKYRTQNQEKIQVKKAAYREANKERMSQWQAGWRQRNQDRVRELNLSHHWGMTLKQYESMELAQSNRCAGCDKSQVGALKKMAIDHDHVTGEIRGLLCEKCNRGMGLLGDSIETLERLIKYLRRNDTSESKNLLGGVYVTVLEAQENVGNDHRKNETQRRNGAHG